MGIHPMFKKVSQAEWLAKANVDLKGKTQAENLKYEVEGGISISPFLTQKDVHQRPSIKGPQTLAGIEIIAKTDKIANQKSKEMLNYGAQVLAFRVSGDTDLDQLFDGIFLDMITVILYIDLAENIRSKVQQYLNSKYQQTQTDVRISDEKNTFYLKEDLSFRQRIIAAGNFMDQKNDDLYMIVELKKDFLAQISELRALRTLIHSQNKKVFIASVTNEDGNTDVHPLIVNNYLLMSAYLGMSDVAFGVPYGEDHELARLSLNIHNVLKEESSFNFVTDPTAGAYIIEKITTELLDISKGR
jgi:hypothetical protein